MIQRSRHALTSMELELARLLAHIDRNQARRFLADPEPPTGFADFADSRSDSIGLVQREAKRQPYDPARFDQDLQLMLSKEKSRG